MRPTARAGKQVQSVWLAAGGLSVIDMGEGYNHSSSPPPAPTAGGSVLEDLEEAAAFVGPVHRGGGLRDCVGLE